MLRGEWLLSTAGSGLPRGWLAVSSAVCAPPDLKSTPLDAPLKIVSLLETLKHNCGVVRPSGRAEEGTGVFEVKSCRTTSKLTAINEILPQTCAHSAARPALRFWFHVDVVSDRVPPKSGVDWVRGACAAEGRQKSGFFTGNLATAISIVIVSVLTR